MNIGGTSRRRWPALVAGLAAAGALAAEPAALADARPSATELVARLQDTPVAELEKRGFVELNLLRNAVFAATGYPFPEERPWLRALFCAPEAAPPAPRGDPGLRLSGYRFPACKEGGALDEAQRKALANLRVATFRRIARFETAGALDGAISQDFRGLAALRGTMLEGRRLSPEAAVAWETSLRRDLAGYRRLRQLVDRPAGFDAMELLGLHAGDVLFLRTLIEAAHGKPISGLLGWEVQQLLGGVEARADYDPAQLPPEVQATLQLLDDVLQRMQRGEASGPLSRLEDGPLDHRAPPLEEEPSHRAGAC